MKYITGLKLRCIKDMRVPGGAIKRGATGTVTHVEEGRNLLHVSMGGGNWFYSTHQMTMRVVDEYWEIVGNA